MERYRLLLPALFLFSSTIASAAEPMRICYFSLNEQKEVETTRNFMKKITDSTGLGIEVKEFLSQGGNPNDSFKKMVASGVKCDGLVISGHHTGAWGGHRAAGKLSLDVIESLSCDPKYADWFRNVNAAWLQGCRTLGVGEIEVNDQQVDADYHTNRVGQVLDADGLEGDLVALNREFSSTLDQDNPLSSRYLRIFPSSKLFGWTKTAPGEKAGSYRSLLYHMAQVSKNLEEDNKYPEQSPLADNWNAGSAARYANAVLLTLNNFSVADKSCEEIATAGWLAHGNVGKPTNYRFDNPDLKTLPSLNSSGNETLLKAKTIDCILKDAIKSSRDAVRVGAEAAKTKNEALKKKSDALRSASEEKFSRALEMISAEPDYLHYSFNTIVDLRGELEKDKSANSQAFMDKLRQLPQIEDFLKVRLKSKQTGTLRKIDFYRFSKDLTGQDNPELEADINNSARKELLRALPELDPTAHNPARSRNLTIAFRSTLFQSVLKNRLAKADFYELTLQGDPEADVLLSLSKYARTFNPRDAKINLLQIVNSPKADAAVANSVLKELAAMQIPANEYAGIYRQLERRFPVQAPANAPQGQPAPQQQQNADPIGNFFRRLF